MKNTPIPIPLYWLVNSYPAIMVYELKSPFNQKKIKKIITYLSYGIFFMAHV